MLYPMFVRRAPYGGFIGDLPDLPGCTPEGYDMDELMADIPRAAALWMEEQGRSSLPAPAQAEPQPDDDGCPPLLVDIG